MSAPGRTLAASALVAARFLLVWLATGALAVIAAETVDRLNLTVTEGLAVYTPITKRYVSP